MMSKQSDNTHKVEKPDSTRQQQTTTPETPSGEFALPDLMAVGPMVETTGESMVQSQANYLNNSQVSTVQRQAMAGQIANTQGNQHMAKVMRALQSRYEQSSTNKSARPSVTESTLFDIPDLGEMDSFTNGSGSPEFTGAPDDSGDNHITNIGNGLVQTKLTVNEPGDAYEQEADAVADTVMRMDSLEDGTLGEIGDLDPIQREASSEVATPSVTPEVEDSISAMQGGGEPLAESDQHFFESRMGADFSDVRIHTDSNAAQTSDNLQAKAFTVDNNIAFNSGQYQPGTDEGRHLIAHELTHVVQQGAANQVQTKPDIQRRAVAQIVVPSPSETVEPPPENASLLSENLQQHPTQQEANSEETAQAEAMEMAELEQTAQESIEEANSEDIAEAEAVETTERENINQEAAEDTTPDMMQMDIAATLSSDLPDLQNEISPMEGPQQITVDLEAFDGDEGVVNEDMMGDLSSIKDQILGQKDAAKGQAEESSSQLDDAISGLADMTDVDIEIGAVEEPAETSGDIMIAREWDGTTSDDTIEQWQVENSFLYGEFISQNAEQSSEIAQSAQNIPFIMDSAIQQSITTLDASVEDNRSVLKTTVEESRNRIKLDAALALVQVENEFNSTIETVGQSTKTATKKVNDQYEAKVAVLDRIEETTKADIDSIFEAKQEDLKQTGPDVGKETGPIRDSLTSEITAPYEGKKPGRFDGADYYERKKKAATDAADQVNQAYKDEFIDKANNAAEQLPGGKPDVLTTFNEKLKTARTNLETEKQNAINEINQAHEVAIVTANQAQASQIEALNQSVQATLKSLKDLGATQDAQLVEVGEQQKGTVERDGQQTVSKLQDSISHTANGLTPILDQFVSQTQYTPLVDPEQVQSSLDSAQGEIDQTYSQLETTLGDSIETSQEILLQAGEQSSQQLNQMGLLAAESVTPIDEAFSNSTADLLEGTRTTFQGIETNHETTVNQRAEKAVTTFDEDINNLQTDITDIKKALEQGLDAFILDFKEGPEGLKQPLLNGKFAQDIKDEAKKAADKVQPRWKRVVALIANIVISIAVGFLIAGLCVGGGWIGLLGALAIGAAGGLLKGGITRWSEGEDIFDAGAMLKDGLLGALEGGLMFAGGTFMDSKYGEGLINKLGGTFLAKVGVNVAVDTIADTIVLTANMAGDNFDAGNWTMEVLKAAGINLITLGLLESGKKGINLYKGKNTPDIKLGNGKTTNGIPNNWSKQPRTASEIKAAENNWPEAPPGYRWNGGDKPYIQRIPGNKDAPQLRVDENGNFINVNTGKPFSTTGKFDQNAAEEEAVKGSIKEVVKETEKRIGSEGAVKPTKEQQQLADEAIPDHEMWRWEESLVNDQQDKEEEVVS